MKVFSFQMRAMFIVYEMALPVTAEDELMNWEDPLKPWFLTIPVV